MSHYLSDNCKVLNNNQGSHFLRIAESADPLTSVHIARYIVPGRCTTYGFELCTTDPDGSEKLSYWSETNVSISDGIALLLEDLERPAVVELFSKFAARARYHKMLLRFLEQLTTKAAAVKAFRLVSDERTEKRHEEILGCAEKRSVA